MYSTQAQKHCKYQQGRARTGGTRVGRATRIVVGNAFGRLKVPWWCLSKRLDCKLKNAIDIVAGWVTLHNLCVKYVVLVFLLCWFSCWVGHPRLSTRQSAIHIWLWLIRLWWKDSILCYYATLVCYIISSNCYLCLCNIKKHWYWFTCPRRCGRKYIKFNCNLRLSRLDRIDCVGCVIQREISMAVEGDQTELEVEAAWGQQLEDSMRCGLQLAA